MIHDLALNMRQKIISLSLDTYELASKKANFSAWVRRKLLEEVEIPPEEVILYGMYCPKCILNFQHPNIAVAKTYKCKFCNGETEFDGVIE